MENIEINVQEWNIIFSGVKVSIPCNEMNLTIIINYNYMKNTKSKIFDITCVPYIYSYLKTIVKS